MILVRHSRLLRPLFPAIVAAGGCAAIALAQAKPETVYVNRTKHYHRKDCTKLEANPQAVRAESLDRAGKSYWPCPDCRPPVRKRDPASEPLGRVR